MKHYDPNSEHVKQWKKKLKERIEKLKIAKAKNGVSK